MNGMFAMSGELGSEFVWLSYFLTYGLVGGYVVWLARRLRRHRR